MPPPHRRLMLIVLGGLAEFELIRVRTSEGSARTEARGVKLGRTPKLTLHQKRAAIKRRDGSMSMPPKLSGMMCSLVRGPASPATRHTVMISTRLWWTRQDFGACDGSRLKFSYLRIGQCQNTLSLPASDYEERPHRRCTSPSMCKNQHFCDNPTSLF